ncbi:unnamed protein product [Cyprideis torosa]|uniref:Uncharacterized protein n=1 Tax=Cyprideis torosa TaxID=163714 RepID=A0A7R8W6K6_9CRUS|nr:unnamed protein product [Cyprideis torosa]CAG0881859.1 unnamed protein product [Cyprideis torosa]
MKNAGPVQSDSEVHIALEDQKKINEFANLNAKREDLKESIKTKEAELLNIEEASEQLSMLELMTDNSDEKVPYFMGEVYVCQTMEETEEVLKKEMERLKLAVEKEKKELQAVKSRMDDLKTNLYAKFGDHINLEASDD